MKFVKEENKRKEGRDFHEQNKKRTHQTRYKTFHPHTQSPMFIEDK
jgi:hypothetical protein